MAWLASPWVLLALTVNRRSLLLLLARHVDEGNVARMLPRSYRNSSDLDDRNARNAHARRYRAGPGKSSWQLRCLGRWQASRRSSGRLLRQILIGLLLLHP